ncbi:hypothetical protein NCS55_00953400 [Fusarium keratoplasticum]|nr:hypothetical protein NCS55_00953400 [Fusarium keratoplasticum]
MTPDRPTKRSRSRLGALCTRLSSRHASDGETTPLTHKATAAQGATIPSSDNSSHRVQTQEPSSAPSSGINLAISPESTTAVLAGSVASNNDSAHQSADDNQSGSASVAHDDATVSVSQELWDTALENLKASEEEPQIVKIIEDFINKASGTPTDPADAQDVVTRIKKEMEQEIDSRRHDGRTTRFIKSVVSSLNKFVSVGDVAVSFDPAHAALPWAAVRAVLVMITAGSDLRNRLIEGIAMVTSLFLTAKMYLRLYLITDLSIKSLPLDVLKSFEIAIVETYTGSMQFLGYAVRQQQQKTRHLKAPMQLDTVADHLTNLNRLGQRLRQAGDDCEKFCSFKDRATAQGLLRTVNDLQKALQGSFAMIVSTHEHTLLSKLPTAGAAFNHLNNQANVQCHPQTREQLLKQIHDWIDEPQGIRAFWLVGLAGTGKSTISKTIAQERDDNCLGASFFFKRGISDQDNGRRFFTTIAHQLAHREPFLRQQICDKIQNEPGLVHSELGIQFERLILEPLRNLEKEKPLVRFVVVIDALDECADRHHAESIIRLLTNTGLKCLKVFLTSRPEYDIRSYFACSAGAHRDLVLHQIDNNVIEHDIRVVLESGLSKFRHRYNKFHRDKDAQLSEDWPGHKKLQDLVTMCTPLFISVATFFRLLEMHPWPATPDYKVNFILQHSAPSDYARLYIPVLSQMLLGPQMDQERVKENFKSIVGPIVLLANPLSATSLSRLLGIDKDVVCCQLDCLSSVLDVPGIEAPVRLFHLSFCDFLVHADAGEFQIDEARVHQELSTRCLVVLSSHLKRDICDVNSPGKDREDFSQELIASHLPSELQYACLYWIYHFKAGGSKMKDGGSVHRFLWTHFLNWLEALSLLDRVYETTRLLNSLQDCIDVRYSTTSSCAHLTWFFSGG